MTKQKLFFLAIGLFSTCILPVVSCSGVGKKKGPVSGSKLATNTPGDSLDLQNLFTLSDAESILGEKGHLKESTLTVKNDVSIYECAYIANSKDQKTGKTGALYVKVEDYSRVSSAAEVYTAIRTANENHAGVKVLDNLGDEAYFHSDGQSFYFILARKGRKILRMKVNKITSNTSLDEFNRIAREVVVSL